MIGINHCFIGNEFFKQQKYPEAIRHYTESLKRNPNDPKVGKNIVCILNN